MRKRDWREVRWHGRGGQGAVTAARVFGAAALREGKYFQAFPEFGPERTGAPVVAFDRIGPTPIWDYSQVYHPDLVVLLDPTLIGSEDLFSGLEGAGKVIINCRDPIPFSLDALGIEGEKEVYIVDASGIARELLGRDLPNTPMVGAAVRVSELVGLEAVAAELQELMAAKRSPEIAARNLEALRRGYGEVVRIDGPHVETGMAGSRARGLDP